MAVKLLIAIKFVEIKKIPSNPEHFIFQKFRFWNKSGFLSN